MKKTEKTNITKRIKKMVKPSSKKGAKKTVIEQKEDPIESVKGKEMSILEKAQMIVDAGPVNGNEFSRMRFEIASRIVEYDRIRTECDIQNEGLSKTIFRLAKPFLNGHFTLAVVGETSAGKSTFINTLIGDNLFPTGKDQTTSALTFIENGKEAKLEVLYCDGHKDPPCIDIVEIKKKLKQLVTVPEEYKDIPVNVINQLISEGYSVDKILSEKPEIERRTRTQRLKAPESLWRKYVNSQSKKDISKAVIITYPLPDEYDGWQIIDTPGAGATGGIQETTQELFNAQDDEKIVDAIIYLQDGTKYMESAVDYDFLEMIVNGLREDAKNRLFFVLTKAAKDESRGLEDFMDRKDKTLQKARELYADGFGISQERFFYIDSILERFKNDLKDKKDFDIAPCPSNWDEEEWNGMTNLYTPIRKYLRVIGKRMINSSINEVMDEWSGFKHFKEHINQFIYSEKEMAYKEICSKIEEDYKGFIKTFQKKIEILKGEKTTIKKEQEKLLNKQSEVNEQLNDLQERTEIDFKTKYDFVDVELSGFSKIGDNARIRTAYFEVLKKLVETKKDIFTSLKQEFKDYWDEDDELSGLLGKIDFDELEKRAENEVDELEQTAAKKASHPGPDKSRPVEKRKGLWEFLIDGIFNGEWRIHKTTYPHSIPVIDEEKQHHILVEDAKQKAREKKKDYIEETTKMADKFKKSVVDTMLKKIEEAKKVLEELSLNMDNKGKEIDAFTKRIAKIEEIMKGSEYGK